MLAGTHVTRTLSVNMKVVSRYARLIGSLSQNLDLVLPVADDEDCCFWLGGIGSTFVALGANF
jgi:hypothetical protein